MVRTMSFSSPSLSGSLRWVALLLPVFAVFSAASTGCANESGIGSNEDDFASEDGAGTHGYGYGYGNQYGHGYGNQYGYAAYGQR